MSVREDRFPFEKGLLPAGRTKDPVRVVVVEITEGRTRGRGEAVPYDRFGETIEEIIDTLERMADEVARGLSRRALQRTLPPGAARSALDLAIWDFDAKKLGSSAALMLGLGQTRRLETAYRIDLDTPEAMAARARDEAHRPILKLNLGARDDLDRIAAVHAAAPKSRLIIDAHERWAPEQLADYMPRLAAFGVELLEQPLPAGQDAALADIRRDIPVSADEACHDAKGLEALIGRYDAVTVSLDKLGGLTAASTFMEAARDLGLKIIVSSPWCSSLGLAPAVLLAQEADWVDLDAPLFLSRDRQPGLRYDGSMLYPPNVALWG